MVGVAALGGGLATALAPAANAAGEGATISGTVTAAAGGATLDGICVTVWQPPAVPDGDPTLVAKTTTGAPSGQAAGAYSLHVAAGTYKLEFDGSGNCPGGGADNPNYIEQWWNGKSDSLNGDPIVVADLDTFTANAAMVAGGAVSGTVTRNGSGFATCVTSRTTDGNDTPTGSVSTGNDGAYVLHGVPAGTTQIVVNEQVPGRMCPGGEVTDPGPTGTYSSVNVTAGSTTSNVDAAFNFPISIDRGTIHQGGSAVLSAAGIAHGTVTFSAPGVGTLCSYTRPAANCGTPTNLAIGTYGPITASYTPSVASYSGDNSSSNSVSLTVDRNPVVPAAPTNVHASVSGTSITVSWSAPGDDGGSAITGYSVKGSHSTSASTSASVFKKTFSHLSAGTYSFTVKATNAIGTGPGAKSNTVTIVVATGKNAGYWMLGADGKVYGFGAAKHFGNAPTPSVAIATRVDGKGYWVVNAAGRVSHFGAAAVHCGSPSLLAGERVSAISATPTGNGYWLFTNRGRAFTCGDAHFYGDMRAVHLNGAIVASAATASGHGYYMIGSDGGVFTFGDAKFHGSTGAMHLNKPVVGISPTHDGTGYWLVASDGGVFAFHAPFRGSMGGTHLNKPVNGLVAFGNGYLMVASDGGVFDFSNQPFLGSLGGTPIPAPIIGIAAFATN